MQFKGNSNDKSNAKNTNKDKNTSKNKKSKPAVHPENAPVEKKITPSQLKAQKKEAFHKNLKALGINPDDIKTTPEDFGYALADTKTVSNDKGQWANAKDMRRGPRQVVVRTEPPNPPLSVSPTGMFIWAYDSTGCQVCGAKNSSYGKTDNPNAARTPYCTRRDIMHPSGRCGRHGGKFKKGIMRKDFKDSSNTKYFGFNPLQRAGIRQSLEDPNLTSMREDIAANDERIKEIAQVLGGLDPEIVKKVFSSAENLQFMLASDFKIDELVEELRQHLELIHNLRARELSWRELQNAQTHRARMVEVENKRVSTEQTQIPVEKVAGLVQRMAKGISMGLREGATKVSEIWFKSLPDERKIPAGLNDLVIQMVETEIMNDIRPTVMAFFPRPVEARNPIVPEEPAEPKEIKKANTKINASKANGEYKTMVTKALTEGEIENEDAGILESEDILEAIEIESNEDGDITGTEIMAEVGFAADGEETEEADPSAD